MNFLTKSITATVLTLTTIGAVNAAPRVIAADNYITSKICAAASGSSSVKLHKVIKDAGLTKQYVVDNVQCNDQNIVSFVSEYGENAEKMVDKLTQGKYKTQVKVTDLASN
ncbi:MAG: DUF3718 domain-containing protein [Gammaproteobacteria bacterium]|nr:DUF3718 domain-containing protein [Gammaproteobacteria bacterium]